MQTWLRASYRFQRCLPSDAGARCSGARRHTLQRWQCATLPSGRMASPPSTARRRSRARSVHTTVPRSAPTLAACCSADRARMGGRGGAVGSAARRPQWGHGAVAYVRMGRGRLDTCQFLPAWPFAPTATPPSCVLLFFFSPELSQVCGRRKLAKVFMSCCPTVYSLNNNDDCPPPCSAAPSTCTRPIAAVQ